MGWWFVWLWFCVGWLAAGLWAGWLVCVLVGWWFGVWWVGGVVGWCGAGLVGWWVGLVGCVVLVGSVGWWFVVLVGCLVVVWCWLWWLAVFVGWWAGCRVFRLFLLCWFVGGSASLLGLFPLCAFGFVPNVV